MACNFAPVRNHLRDDQSHSYRDFDITVPGEIKHVVGYTISVWCLFRGVGRDIVFVFLLDDLVVEELVVPKVLYNPNALSAYPEPT